MTDLKLAALDEDDLVVLSAHLQDAVMTVADIDWQPRNKRLLLAMNRFAWDAKGSFLAKARERRRAVLQFDRVSAIRTIGIDRGKPGDVLSLLAVRPGDPAKPAGTIELVFSGGAMMRLDVECVEARLTDLGTRWQAAGRPVHGV